MTALAAERRIVQEHWKYRKFTLTSGQKAYKGAKIAINTSTGNAVVGATGTTLFPIGIAAETVDATSGAKQLNVELDREIVVKWFKNDTGTAVVAANVGSLCYILDDQTVTGSASGNSVAGRVWAVDTTLGVAVEQLQAVPAAFASLNGVGFNGAVTDPTFTANDAVIASPVNGAVYLVPQNGAAATVTLPATCAQGAFVVYAYDGTGGTAGNTITYRQGTTALTAALAGNKRHVAFAVGVTTNIWAVTVTAQP